MGWVARPAEGHETEGGQAAPGEQAEEGWGHAATEDPGLLLWQWGATEGFSGGGGGGASSVGNVPSGPEEGMCRGQD